MHLERYPIYDVPGESTMYEFVSIGPKGSIRKAVVFTEMVVRNFYNLGFGDVISGGSEDELDDEARSDNSDTKLVLATVAAIVLAFTEKNPDAMIFASGSTTERTRLYRMGLTAHLAEIEPLLQVFGLREADGEWETFTIGAAYDAFYVMRKK